MSNPMYNLTKSGSRMAVSSKVNDSLIMGVSMVDTMIPVGRGQSQLMLGDRYTGKTAMFIMLLVYLGIIDGALSIDGLGTKSVIGMYVGIGQNLSKLTMVNYVLYYISQWSLIIMSHAASSVLLSYMIPLMGISVSESISDKGMDVAMCFDDLSKHSSSYSQMSLILGKIPASDAFPADMFNIHASLLESCGKLNAIYFGGSISCFPMMETINSDMTEYMATNIISMTDGQFYLSSGQFLDGVSPAVNTALSVSSIGSNAQSSLMKNMSMGIKNEMTYYSMVNSLEDKLVSSYDALNSMFLQDFMFVSLVELSIMLMMYYSVGVLFGSLISVHSLLYVLGGYMKYLFYMVSMAKNVFSYSLYNLVVLLVV